MEPQGKKEVVEAVVIAALAALATQLITWAVEHAKSRAQKKKDQDA